MEHTKGKLVRHDFWLDLIGNQKPPISIAAVCTNTVEISNKEAIANAEHLVKCWNSHDKLLAACEGLMKEADNGSARFDDPPPDSIFIMAEQAIAEAKGE